MNKSERLSLIEKIAKKIAHKENYKLEQILKSFNFDASGIGSLGIIEGREEFVYNKLNQGDDDKILELASHLGLEVANLDNPKSTIAIDKNRKIFISHSNKDEELVRRFTDEILILGLEVERSAIFCTSIQGMDIKSGEDFKVRIKNELLGSQTVIQIITKNYKSSEICLNEMGAAWVIAKNIIPLILDPFNYDIGFIHASSIQLKLNSQKDLIKLLDDHKSSLTNKNINIGNFQTKVDKFINFVNGYIERQETKTDSVYFYNEEVSLKGLLREGVFSRPWTVDDEKIPIEEQTFHRYYYLDLTDSIEVLSGDILKEEGDPNVSKTNIDRVQIFYRDDLKHKIKNLQNTKVSVKGHFFAAHTGWHRTDVLIDIVQISSIQE